MRRFTLGKFLLLSGFVFLCLEACTDFTSTSAAAGIISNWIVSPVITMRNGDKIVFYTRTILYPLTGGDSTY